MQRTALRRVATTAIALAALGLGTLATAGPASAAEKNGYLESGEFGLFFNTGPAGAVWDLYYQDVDFWGEKFPGPGNGTDDFVNDNTAGYNNRDSVRWWVYTDANAGGYEGSLPAGYIGNATATFKNKISSAYFYEAS
ncbi:hypothetical protein O1L60_22405 [Streptomyces diastatochromogenes]|nr:hypothetical protein [Streptomyces diastatochromogenes]